MFVISHEQVDDKTVDSGVDDDAPVGRTALGIAYFDVKELADKGVDKLVNLWHADDDEEDGGVDSGHSFW